MRSASRAAISGNKTSRGAPTALQASQENVSRRRRGVNGWRIANARAIGKRRRVSHGAAAAAHHRCACLARNRHAP